MILVYVKLLEKKLTSTFLKWDLRKIFDIVLRIQKTYLLLKQTVADLMYIAFYSVSWTVAVKKIVLYLMWGTMTRVFNPLTWGFHNF